MCIYKILFLCKNNHNVYSLIYINNKKYISHMCMHM